MNEGGLRLTVSVNISADPVFQVTKLNPLLLEISTPDANEVDPSVPKVQVDVELLISVFNITVAVDIIKGVSIAPTVTPLVLSNGF